MKWKEFLKPNWRKIVIFFLFSVVLTYFLPLIPVHSQALCEICPELRQCHEQCQGKIECLEQCPSCSPCPSKTEMMTFVEAWNGRVWKRDWYRTEYTFYIISTQLVELIGVYLLSCLIVSIYDKVRKK